MALPTGLIPSPEFLRLAAQVSPEDAARALLTAVDRLNANSTLPDDIYRRAQGEIVWADQALREAAEG